MKEGQRGTVPGWLIRVGIALGCAILAALAGAGSLSGAAKEAEGGETDAPSQVQDTEAYDMSQKEKEQWGRSGFPCRRRWGIC